jgi:hypothetical protein
MMALLINDEKHQIMTLIILYPDTMFGESIRKAELLKNCR